MNRSKKVTGRGQILTILKANSRSIARESGEICTAQTLLQPICFKSDRLVDRLPPDRVFTKIKTRMIHFIPFDPDIMRSHGGSAENNHVNHIDVRLGRLLSMV
jgi:hypothetical protein